MLGPVGSGTGDDEGTQHGAGQRQLRPPEPPALDDLDRQQVDPRDRSPGDPDRRRRPGRDLLLDLGVLLGELFGHQIAPSARPTGTAASGLMKSNWSWSRPVRPIRRGYSG